MSCGIPQTYFIFAGPSIISTSVHLLFSLFQIHRDKGVRCEDVQGFVGTDHPLSHLTHTTSEQEGSKNSTKKSFVFIALYTIPTHLCRRHIFLFFIDIYINK